MPANPLLLIAAFLAVVSLGSLRYRPYPGSFLVKSAPILCLAAAAFSLVKGPEHPWLGIALLFSAGGDIALDFYRGRSERFFLLGLGLFWIAHLFYMVAFTRTFQLFGAPLWLLAPVLSAVALLVWQLSPRLGRLRRPVLLYIAVITGMVVSAVGHAPTHGWLIAGALTFMLSDSLIAVDKFLRPVPARDLAILSSYYVAQWLITLSFVMG